MGVSYTGLAGAALGLVICTGLAVAIAAGAGTASRWWALALAAAGVLFVPAIIASAAETSRRTAVLKTTTVCCLVLAGVGLVIDPSLTVLLAPPITLLAVAAGFVMQGRR